ncbi:MAG TPA: glutamate--tRNA ligase [Candidatus Megaira endosymbiont of Hartmannula sinica]|nr:glutamate--tRNA ligase [Candidatus Megaera endosymbiont of Hartmannula sinica]
MNNSFNKIRTRFAPSPTGYMHIGNARIALLNYLYARQNKGEFVLRIDDTDLERVKQEYKDALFKDLDWMGIDYDLSFNQSDRIKKYDLIRDNLIKQGFLYPCFETKEELDIKRKFQLSRGKPPIYDRSSLNLTIEEIEGLIKQGKKPHYRFKLSHKKIKWSDKIKGDICFDSKDMSDPILIRENGSYTYMLCSVIDDIDYSISDIIRGEDHLSNTAIQIEIFNALEASIPNFSHISLMKSIDSTKISKRNIDDTSVDESNGSRKSLFSLASLRSNSIENLTLNSFLCFVGSSNNIRAVSSNAELINNFDINSYSKSPCKYDQKLLEDLNYKIISGYSFKQAKEILSNRLEDSHINNTNSRNTFKHDLFTEEFWLLIRKNISSMNEVIIWQNVCFNTPDLELFILNNKDDIKNLSIDEEIYKRAIDLLPQEINEDSWSIWTKEISKVTGRKGKKLFMPIRIALTGFLSGPELKFVIAILVRKEIIARLEKAMILANI